MRIGVGHAATCTAVNELGPMSKGRPQKEVGTHSILLAMIHTESKS